MSWDIFIAHAGPDKEVAEVLYELLDPHACVFLDTRCLKLGDDWDVALQQAQRDSRVSVIIVSEKTGRAFYQREEIAAAISLARERGEAHRVVPLYLGAVAPGANDVPYGLRLKHGMEIKEPNDLQAAALKLLDLLSAPLAEGSKAVESAGSEDPCMDEGEWDRFLRDRAGQESAQFVRRLQESPAFFDEARAALARSSAPRGSADVRIRAENVAETGIVTGIEGLPLDVDSAPKVKMDVKDIKGRTTGIKGGKPREDGDQSV